MLSTRPQNKNFGDRAGKASSIRKAKREQAYYDNPRLCDHCSTVLKYRKYGKFCNHSCAASYTNKTRKKRSPMSQKQRDQIRETMRKRWETIPKKIPQARRTRTLSLLQFSSCEMCHNAFYVKHHNNIKINRCPECKLATFSKLYFNICNVCNDKFIKSRYNKYCNNCSPNIRHYRTRAAFKFNVYDYPSKFNLSLISQHGWYSPNGYKRKNKTPNLSGVSRDHLYSVSDGFKNHIDPSLLAHPANCCIMIHNGDRGNNQKNTSSSITINQLLILIENWEDL